MIIIPNYIKEGSKVIGYFSYSDNSVLCDGDACIIAGTEELIKFYLQKISNGSEGDKIKKTRFGEIIEGMRYGGAYAFDEESYDRFYQLAELNGMNGLLKNDISTKPFSEEMHFIRVQIN